MDDYAFEPAPRPSVEIAGGTSRFPVRRIVCVGQNYAAHAREMGGDPDRAPPFFFTKPADAVVPDGATIPYPPMTTDLQHEVELVVALGRGGASIAPEDALSCVFGYAVGIDLTRRDLQREAKSTSRPWDWAKAFDRSAPVGAIRPVAEVGHPASGRIALAVNDRTVQDGDLSDMIWKTAEIIAAASRAIALMPGDLIFTGTPAGVGPIVSGDLIEAVIEGVGGLSVRIGGVG